MTIAAVGGQAGGNNANVATSVTRAFGSNVTAGSLLVIVAGRVSTTDTWVSGDCTQSAGTATVDTITLDRTIEVNDGTGFTAVGIWSCIVTSTGSCTMQVAGAPSGAYLILGTHEFTGSWDASRAESGNSGSSATDDQTSASSGNATSAGAALYIGGFSLNGIVATTITPDAAFTTIFEQEDGVNFLPGSVIYRIVSSGTTDAADWTMTGVNDGWAAAVQVYKEAAGSSIPVIMHHLRQQGIS